MGGNHPVPLRAANRCDHPVQIEYVLSFSLQIGWPRFRSRPPDACPGTSLVTTTMELDTLLAKGLRRRRDPASGERWSSRPRLARGGAVT
jgi:hypothetical protein